jgi:hypothetical protein
MSDRASALILGTLALLAFVLFVAWHADLVLKWKCAHAGGTWNAAQRTCDINAGPARAVRVSPHR